MTLPIDLVLIRHGESEGNIATKLSKQGDNRHFTPEFRARHSSQFRLTTKGQAQADAAGEWIRKNFYAHRPFDKHITSEYIRAMETAARLKLPNAHWQTEYDLRERDWGQMDVLPDDERRTKFGDAMRLKNTEPFYWKPVGGESMANLCLRLRSILDKLHRECTDKRVIIVCHGEVMTAFQIRLERLTQWRYKKRDLSKNPHDRIHNCQILHYTRVNPETGKQSHYADWVRSVCPWDMSLSSNEWRKIERKKYTNEDLLCVVNRVPSLVEPE